MTLSQDDLELMERRVRRALETGDEGELDVLGYGEISTVIEWRVGDEGFACKRLPPFPDEAAFVAYESAFSTYLERLRGAGIRVIESGLRTVQSDDGAWTVWCVQPLLDDGALIPKVLESGDGDRAARIIDVIVARIMGSVGPTLGVDAQASNWAWIDDEAVYVDVTTPMMRDADGRELLDLDLFLASLPWILRGAVRRFMLGEILDKYYEPRGALVDLAGNLHKEGLGELVPALLERCNEELERPIEDTEVRAYYRDDARMWGLLQRLRRADRWWSRTIRRRTYPFLLPGAIERRV